MFASKRFWILFSIAVTVLFGPFFVGYHFTTIKDVSLGYISKGGQTRDFHLVIPATGPNLNFCRLLLSAAVTGWPEPIFVGWNGRGVYNGSESHLFKVTETLTYLRSLPPSADNDLVLMVDAYAVWMQLGPEITISRYHDVLRKNDERLRRDGILQKHHAGADVHHSIVFSADKVHFPHEDLDAAAWAVPESSLPQHAFGPETDETRFAARPRWLNSGTIMGPVKDMRDMFHATLDMMSRKYDVTYEYRTSDQYYFAEVFAEQEINRRRLLEDFDEGPPINGEAGRVPDIPTGKRTEFHICLDYEAEMFQPVYTYDQHLTWMRYNQSISRLGSKGKRSSPDSQIPADLMHGSRIDGLTLEGDISSTSPPYWMAGPKDRLPTNERWEDQALGTNTITQHVFPLLHITGDKSFRDRYWPKLWFHPHGEELLKATKRRQALQAAQTLSGDDEKDTLVPTAYDFANVGGTTWRGAIPARSPKSKTPKYDEKGGAWLDNGEYWGWKQLCGNYERKANRDQLYVPADWAGRERPEEVVKDFMPPR